MDAGLRFENRKQKYQFMFNIKTPKRTYYLVAENEADMNKWVDAVCQVCGLKAQDDEQPCQSMCCSIKNYIIHLNIHIEKMLMLKFITHFFTF